MSHDAPENTPTRDYSEIAYYGRPITKLTKEELLAAFAELVDIYTEVKTKNDKCKKLLGDNKFESL